MKVAEFFMHLSVTISLCVMFFTGWVLALVFITKWPFATLLLSGLMIAALLFHVVKREIEDYHARLEWEQKWKSYWDKYENGDYQR